MEEINTECENSLTHDQRIEARKCRVDTVSDVLVENRSALIRGLESCLVVKIADFDDSNLSEHIPLMIKQSSSKTFLTNRETALNEDFPNQDFYSRTDFLDVLQVILLFAAHRKEHYGTDSPLLTSSDNESSVEEFFPRFIFKSGYEAQSSSPCLTYDENSSSSGILTNQGTYMDDQTSGNCSLDEDFKPKNIQDVSSDTSNSSSDATLTENNVCNLDLDINNNTTSSDVAGGMNIAMSNGQPLIQVDVISSSEKRESKLISNSISSAKYVKEQNPYANVVNNEELFPITRTNMKISALPLKKRIILFEKIKVPKNDVDQDVSNKNEKLSVPEQRYDEVKTDKTLTIDSISKNIEVSKEKTEKPGENPKHMSFKASIVQDDALKIRIARIPTTSKERDINKPQEKTRNVNQNNETKYSQGLSNASCSYTKLILGKRSSYAIVSEVEKLVNKRQKQVGENKLQKICKTNEREVSNNYHNKAKRRYSVGPCTSTGVGGNEVNKLKPIVLSTASDLRNVSDVKKNKVPPYLKKQQFKENTLTGRTFDSADKKQLNVNENTSKMLDSKKLSVEGKRRHSISSISSEVQVSLKKITPAHKITADTVNEANKLKIPSIESNVNSKNCSTAVNQIIDLNSIEKENKFNSNPENKCPEMQLQKISTSEQNSAQISKDKIDPELKNVTDVNKMSIPENAFIEMKTSNENGLSLEGETCNSKPAEKENESDPNRITYNYGRMVLALCKKGMLECNIFSLLSYQAGSSTMQYKSLMIQAWHGVYRLPRLTVLKFQDAAQAVKAHQELNTKYRKIVQTLPMKDLLKTVMNMEVSQHQVKCSTLFFKSKKKQAEQPDTKEFENCLPRYGDVISIRYLEKNAGSELKCDVQYKCVTQALLALVALDGSYVRSVGGLCAMFKKTKVNELFVSEIVGYIREKLEIS